jgi:hypothetical protein
MRHIKLRETAKMERQRFLAVTKDRAEQSITGLEVIQDEVWLRMESSQEVHVGRLSREDVSFLASLHHPDLEPRITGGGLVLEDEEGRKLAEVSDWTQLDDAQMGLVLEGVYTLKPKFYGVNIEYKAE